MLSNNFICIFFCIAIRKDIVLNMQHLTLLKWIDRESQSHSLSLRYEMSPKWCDVGDLLGVDSSCLKAIHLPRMGDVEQCCRDVLQDWLQMEEPSYLVNWEGLLELLKDLKLNNVAKKLKDALHCMNNS